MAGRLSERDSIRSIAQRAGEPVAEVIDVSKRWLKPGLFERRAPARSVLSKVSFAAGRGEIVVVLGENGSGKTTLLKIVAGLSRPDTGRVHIAGCDVYAAAASVRGRVAYAGGERGFYFRLTARENLAFFGSLDGLRARERADRIRSVAHTVDIESDLDRPFANLSSGLRQRLAVARALLTDPEILLLDEPTRTLDPPHAADLRRFVRETLVARCGKTVIIATNLIDEALEVAGRIAVLRAKTLEFVELPSRQLNEWEIRELFGMTGRA